MIFLAVGLQHASYLLQVRPEEIFQTRIFIEMLANDIKIKTTKSSVYVLQLIQNCKVCILLDCQHFFGQANFSLDAIPS